MSGMNLDQIEGKWKQFSVKIFLLLGCTGIAAFITLLAAFRAQPLAAVCLQVETL
jgi:predicted membrane channel-forming protein YqfA (hemolysin III family)